MKKFKLFLFVLIAIFGFGIVNVSAETEGAFTYTVDGSNVTITDYSDDGSKDVVIPSAIDGNPVTAIGDVAFSDKSLTSIIIPDTVVSIGSSSFSRNLLENVVIPEGVISIGDNAFSNNKLVSVSLPDSLIKTGETSFANNKIKSLVIPKGVTLGRYTFLFNEISDLVLPDGLTTITEGAFACNNLTNVTIPESVTKIGALAFFQNYDLEIVKFLGNPNDIGNHIFQGTSADLKVYGYADGIVDEYIDSDDGNTDAIFIPWVTLTNEMISDIPNQIYTGDALTPEIVVTYNDVVLTKDVDYTVSYENNIQVGTAKAIITGLDKFFGSSVEKTFTIAKKQYSISIDPITGATITPNDTVKVDYDGSQNYTIKSEDGYKITSILLNGVEKLSTLENDVLTIKNPTEDITIEVKTEKLEEPSVTPSDVKENPKTSDSVLLYIGLGLVSLVVLTGTNLYSKKRFN